MHGQQNGQLPMGRSQIILFETETVVALVLRFTNEVLATKLAETAPI